MNENLASAKPGNEERKWAVILHLSPLAGLLFPMAGFLTPLLIWLLKKSESPYIYDQGKEVLNFIITILIYGLLAFILMPIISGFFLIGLFLIWILILTIISAAKVSEGNSYRYPYILRFLK